MYGNDDTRERVHDHQKDGLVVQHCNFRRESSLPISLILNLEAPWLPCFFIKPLSLKLGQISNGHTGATQQGRQTVYYLHELKDDRVKFHRDIVWLNIEEIMTDYRH